MTYQPIPETISFLMAQTCRAHRSTADRLLAEVCLHVGQEMILCRLWQEDGLTQTDLAERLGVQPATVTKMLHRMAQMGLVECRKDPADRRISRVHLTEPGRELQNAVEGVWHRLEELTVAALSFEDQILLRRLLAQVRDNLTAGAEPDSA